MSGEAGAVYLWHDGRYPTDRLTLGVRYRHRTEAERVELLDRWAERWRRDGHEVSCPSAGVILAHRVGPPRRLKGAAIAAVDAVRMPTTAEVLRLYE